MWTDRRTDGQADSYISLWGYKNHNTLSNWYWYDNETSAVCIFYLKKYDVKERIEKQKCKPTEVTMAMASIHYTYKDCLMTQVVAGYR